MTQAKVMSRLQVIKKDVEKQLEKRLSFEQFLEGIEAEDIFQRLWPIKDSLRAPCPQYHSDNIDGWSVRCGDDGYYRMYKTVEGKTECIYLGKRLDWEKARRKIAAKEKKLGFLF